MNNIDQKLWTNEEFFNPFGPEFLRLKINEDIRLKLLDLITLWLQSHEPVNFTAGAPEQMQSIKNSIVDGKMGRIYARDQGHDEWRGGDPKNIIKNTIEGMLCRYGELYYNQPCLSTITDVWYGVMKAGDFHILHSHHSLDINIAVLAGAIYLEVPDNLPDPQGNMNWILGGTGGHGRWHLGDSTWGCSPKLGDVFLWPAWLMHTVYPFRSKQERIMISFNGQIVCR
tara:strand:- start:333 stop:1013 length:681 start_codon:yes stop_codon:yes gene_type:complete